MWDGWSEFWFSGRDLYHLAIFRIILCFTLFSIYVGRQMDVTLFFTDKGILPKELATSVIPDFYRPYFVFSFWSDAWVPTLHLLFVFSLLLLALGVGGRILTLIAWLLQIAFLQRNYSIAFGADLIGGIFLFYMIFTQSCAELSAWTWFKKKFLGKTSKVVSSDIFTSVFYRIIQVQLCVIYFYTGLEKLKGNSWWDGTALWSVFANPQMMVADFTWLKNFPLLVVMMTFVTVLFEVYFPVLVWVRKTRIWLLLAGVGFHIGIGVFMHLYSFAFVMMAPYILFVSKRDFENLRRMS